MGWISNLFTNNDAVQQLADRVPDMQAETARAVERSNVVLESAQKAAAQGTQIMRDFAADLRAIGNHQEADQILSELGNSANQAASQTTETVAQTVSNTGQQVAEEVQKQSGNWLGGVREAAGKAGSHLQASWHELPTPGKYLVGVGIAACAAVAGKNAIDGIRAKNEPLQQQVENMEQLIQQRRAQNGPGKFELGLAQQGAGQQVSLGFT